MHYLNEALSQGLAAESGSAYHDQRNRWCRGSLQILFMEYGHFGSGLRPMQRLLFLQQEWLLNGIFPIVFSVSPALVWAMCWWIHPDVHGFDIILTPALLVAVIYIFLFWISARIFVPLIVTPAFHFYTSVGMLPTAITTLLRPFGTPLVKILPVTAKGDAARTSGVDWPMLLVAIAIMALIVGGLANAVVRNDALLAHDVQNAALLFWTFVVMAELAVVVRCCLASGSGDELWVDVDQPCGIAVDGAVMMARLVALAEDAAIVDAPCAAGSGTGQPSLDVIGVGRLPVDVVRWDGDGRCVMQFAALPMAQRHALLRSLYATPRRRFEEKRTYSLTPIYASLTARVLWS